MPSWSLHPYDEWPTVNTIPAHLSHFAADTLTSLFIFYMWSYQNLYFSNNSLCNPAFPNDLFKIPPCSHSAFPIHFSTFFQCGTVVILHNNVYDLSHLECEFIRAFYVHCCSTSALYMLTTWLFLRNMWFSEIVVIDKVVQKAGFDISILDQELQNCQKVCPCYSTSLSLFIHMKTFSICIKLLSGRVRSKSSFRDWNSTKQTSSICLSIITSSLKTPRIHFCSGERRNCLKEKAAQKEENTWCPGSQTKWES